MSKKVFVGLSGGVDSSVSAALLKEQGFDVIGVYMKNWSQRIGTFECPWEQDYKDAKRVAVQLGVPFEMVDFEKDYFEKVVEYMLDAFKSGITPNPDVMCNQEIKFKLFFDYAMQHGADMIATGHYAKASREGENAQNAHLLRAKDENKDQTYFLYRTSQKALQKTVFPLGNFTKPEVRELAQKYKLATATKKESMGICFVGKVGIREFLKQYVQTEPGGIVDQYGKVIGTHEGAIFYTIGQRHGLNVGGGLPYYVTSKNMFKNEVYVTSDIADPLLWSDIIKISSVHLIGGRLAPNALENGLFVRTRHRAPLMRLSDIAEAPELSDFILTTKQPMLALTPGQSAVLYTETECLGGGIIC